MIPLDTEVRRLAIYISVVFNGNENCMIAKVIENIFRMTMHLMNNTSRTL